MPHSNPTAIPRDDAMQATVMGAKREQIQGFVHVINLMGDTGAGTVDIADNEKYRDIEKSLREAAKVVGKKLVIKKGENPKKVYFWVHPRDETRLKSSLRAISEFLTTIKPKFLYLGAALLLAYAASLPLWIGSVRGGTVIPLESQALIGLVALLIAVLALVGGVTYIRLRDEVHSQVQSSVVIPLTVARIIADSYTLFHDYSEFDHHIA